MISTGLDVELDININDINDVDFGGFDGLDSSDGVFQSIMGNDQSFPSIPSSSSYSHLGSGNHHHNGGMEDSLSNYKHQFHQQQQQQQQQQSFFDDFIVNDISSYTNGGDYKSNISFGQSNGVDHHSNGGANGYMYGSAAGSDPTLQLDNNNFSYGMLENLLNLEDGVNYTIPSPPISPSITSLAQIAEEALTTTLAASRGGSTSPSPTSPSPLKRSSIDDTRTGRSKAQKLWKVTSPSELSDQLIAKSQRSGSRSRSPSPTTSPRTGRKKASTRSPDIIRTPGLPLPASLLNHVNDGQPVTMPVLPINPMRSPANVLSPRTPAADSQNVFNLMETISKLDQTTRTLMKQSLERLAKKADNATDSSAPPSPLPLNDETRPEAYLDGSIRSPRDPQQDSLETTLEQRVMNMLLTVSSPMSSPRDRHINVGEPINPFSLPTNNLMNMNTVSSSTQQTSPRVVVPPIPLGFINNVNNVNNQNTAYKSPSPSPRSPREKIASSGATTPKQQQQQQQQQQPASMSPHPSAVPMQQVQVNGAPNQTIFSAPGGMLPEGTYMYAPGPSYVAGGSPWWTVNVGGQQRLINSSLYPYMVNNRTVLLPNTALDQQQNLSQQGPVFIQGQYAARPDGRNINYYQQAAPAPTPKSPSKNRKRSTSGTRRSRKADGTTSLTSSAESITSPRSIPNSPRASINASPSPVPPLVLSNLVPPIAMSSPRLAPASSSPRVGGTSVASISSPRVTHSPRSAPTSLSSPRSNSVSSPRLATHASVMTPASMHSQSQMGTVTLVSYAPSPYYMNPISIPTPATTPTTVHFNSNHPPSSLQSSSNEFGGVEMSDVDSFYNMDD